MQLAGARCCKPRCLGAVSLCESVAHLCTAALHVCFSFHKRQAVAAGLFIESEPSQFSGPNIWGAYL
uniref:Uncharacterized protein n=1 Tax=Anguilla anguilla TaxID=7936 RepID=A0A0E9RQM9_ANGAN